MKGFLMPPGAGDESDSEEMVYRVRRAAVRVGTRRSWRLELSYALCRESLWQQTRQRPAGRTSQ